MTIALTAEHRQLASSVRRWVEDHDTRRGARRAVDDGGTEAPAWWSALIGQGWHLLHLPEEHGGAGFGMQELAVVVEQLGRGMTPGPFVPTVIALDLIRLGAAPGAGPRLLAPLVGGETAAVAMAPDGVRAVTTDDGATLDGVSVPIDGAMQADWFVLAGHLTDGDVGWWLVPAGAVTVRPVPGVDGTRPVGEVVLDAVAVPVDRQLSLDGQQVRDRAVVVHAAEAAGLAGWCVDTAAEYAKVREQFGRPIGQFQAVKHRCAEMLVQAEQARAAAWDAARARDGAGASPALAAAVAGAIAIEAAFTTAKDAIQVLGGIGFTWEHDVHLYLKRAMAVRQWLGSPGLWEHRCADLVLAGARREPTVDLPAEAARYRDEVRAFAEDVATLDSDTQHQRIVGAGYLHPHLPAPWGRDAEPLEQLVIEEEFVRAGVQRRNLVVAEWVIPTLVQFGTEEQQQRWLPDTYAQRLQWCQLFSEPGAGSDLASLSAKATRVEGGWRISGQKVWTSLAQAADLGILLARTDADGPKHHGITYFVIEMDQPGIDVRPLRELTGHALFNEVFLQDAFVPDESVIGEVDDGWRVARGTLASERISIGGNSPFRGEARDLLETVTSSGAADHADVRRDLGRLLAQAVTVSLLGARTTLRQLEGEDAGGGSSIRKLVGVELEQQLSQMAWELLGPAAATMRDPAEGRALAFLMNRAKTIYGGTSEIQRNVIAERLLGLPRDPEPCGHER